MRTIPAHSIRAGCALALVFLLWPGHRVKGAGDDEFVSPGTERMAQRLRQLIGRSRGAFRNTAYTDAQVAEWKRQVEEALDLPAQIKARSHLGQMYVQSGNTEDAIEQFELTMAALNQVDISPSPEAIQKIRQWLAISYLRLAEQENCIALHGRDSCLMPIKGTGVHVRRRGSTKAIEMLEASLRARPDDLGLRWLLNLAYMTLGEYPNQVPAQWLIPEAVFKSDYELTRFFDVASGAGVDTIGLSGGVVMEDLDGDQLLDLVVSDWSLSGQMRFHHNNGDGTFEDRTRESGLTGQLSGLNLLHADYNNDGFADILVLRGAWLGQDGRHPNSLLRNNGDGTFDDVTEEAGLLCFHPTQTAAFADYDNDGWIDLFIGNESAGHERHPCQLFHNNGDGTFTDVARMVGVSIASFVKGTVWGDYNNDGRPDLYVSRFGKSNLLFRNEGPVGEGWTFEDVTSEARIQHPHLSFPTWFWDYDNDGWEDLLVAPFAGFGAKSLGKVAADYLLLPTDGARLRLYRNLGNGSFEDVTRATSFDALLLAMGANFGDLDNDGFLDCYFGTGEPFLGTLVPNRMFRNNGGKVFQDVTTSGGFGHLQKGHGVAFGDLDNDGDQDVYAVMGGAYFGDVYQNVLFENPGNGNHWITLKLEGVTSNRSAIGARIKVTVEKSSGPQDIHVTVGTGGSFGSNSLQQEIGLGSAARIQQIEINWPTSGERQVFTDVALDRFYHVREGATKPVAYAPKRFSFPAPEVY